MTFTTTAPVIPATAVVPVTAFLSNGDLRIRAMSAFKDGERVNCAGILRLESEDSVFSDSLVSRCFSVFGGLVVVLCIDICS